MAQPAAEPAPATVPPTVTRAAPAQPRAALLARPAELLRQAPAAHAPPRVEINIGTILVRASATAPTGAPPESLAAQRRSTLAAYLARRTAVRP
jgi:hypothetical protein